MTPETEACERRCFNDTDFFGGAGMAAGDFRIFISAVTSELGQARDALAADLRARRLAVKVQSEFRQEAESDTLLSKLHDYIRDCAAVVCLIGKRSGACPTVAEAASFAQM